MIADEGNVRKLYNINNKFCGVGLGNNRELVVFFANEFENNEDKNKCVTKWFWLLWKEIINLF